MDYVERIGHRPGRLLDEQPILNVQRTLKNRYGFPVLADMIAETTVDPHPNAPSGTYGPIVADETLFDLNRWFVKVW
jgi:hypothetical protein